MTEQELTPEQNRILEKVEKLLRLAARNPNSEEAASASAKAQELLTAYNLEQIEVNAAEDKSAVRERVKIRGGMYEYQRELWDAIAQLNFCLHWVIRHTVERGTRRRSWDGTMVRGTRLDTEFRHHIVGRVVNTRSTRVMAEYLEQTIERLVAERFPLNSQRFKSEAVAYREGLSEQIVIRLHERRTTQEAERRRSEAQRARSGVASVSQALTIADYSRSERDANMDEVMGEGWSARQREERRRQAEAVRAAEEAYTRWAEANPEEAAKEEKERRKKQRTRYSGGQGSRGGTTGRERRSWTQESAQGYDRGRDISLDQQAGRSSPALRLTND